jgi:hypothetical protein
VRSIAREVVDALPTTVEEVVVTGSVSRGVADDISDIEMLVVTGGELAPEDCYTLAARPASGLAVTDSPHRGLRSRIARTLVSCAAPAVRTAGAG